MPAVIWLVLPDEISASSFRPSSPLLPRFSSPSLPSSYAFFLFCFCLPPSLSPLLLSLILSASYSFPPRLILRRRSRKAETFSAIVGLLIALGFPPLLSGAFFSSYLNLSFSPLHFFPSPSMPSRVFRVSLLKRRVLAPRFPFCRHLLSSHLSRVTLLLRISVLILLHESYYVSLALILFRALLASRHFILQPS